MTERSLSHLEDAQFMFSNGGDPCSRGQLLSAQDPAMQAIMNELIHIRKKLDTVPHSEQGINLLRVRSFLKRQGLAMLPFVCVDQAGKQLIHQALEEVPRANQVASSLPLTGFIYAVRPEHDTARSMQLLEANLIHEQAHANSTFHDVKTFKRQLPSHGIGYSLLRNGFQVGDGNHARGAYPEEGYAQALYHRYVTDELDLSNGFMEQSNPQLISAAIGRQAARYLLPGSYIYPSAETNEPRWHVSAQAAFGMQLLTAKDPHISTILPTTRHSTSGLRQFAERVNMLSPGLYYDIHHPTYDGNQFAIATQGIINRLYHGDAEHALAAVNQQAKGQQIAA
jgi:hypothetical protein